MAHNVGRGEYVPTGDSGLTSGRGRLLNELCNTPVRVPGNVGSPAFSSTRLSNSLLDPLKCFQQFQTLVTQL